MQVFSLTKPQATSLAVVANRLGITAHALARKIIVAWLQDDAVLCDEEKREDERRQRVQEFMRHYYGYPAWEYPDRVREFVVLMQLQRWLAERGE